MTDLSKVAKLVERSSLGTVGARRLGRRTPLATATEIVDQTHADPRQPYVFISYRHDDAAAAYLIDQVLSARFGPNAVFHASEAVRPGESFSLSILRAVHRATAIVAVIGPSWQIARGLAAVWQYNLDETDWVRREIAEALTHDVPVVPVLVDTTVPLDSDNLPDDIAPLASCQHMHLHMHHRARGDDLARIVDALSSLMSTQQCSAEDRFDHDGSSSPPSLAPLHPSGSYMVRTAVARVHDVDLIAVEGSTSLVTPTTRDRLAAELRKKYDAGQSIRALAEAHGRSYGFVHRILTESGATLRGRGGASRRRKKKLS